MASRSIRDFDFHTSMNVPDFNRRRASGLGMESRKHGQPTPIRGKANTSVPVIRSNELSKLMAASGIPNPYRPVQPERGDGRAIGRHREGNDQRLLATQHF